MQSAASIDILRFSFPKMLLAAAATVVITPLVFVMCGILDLSFVTGLVSLATGGNIGVLVDTFLPLMALASLQGMFVSFACLLVATLLARACDSAFGVLSLIGFMAIAAGVSAAYTLCIVLLGGSFHIRTILAYAIIAIDVGTLYWWLVRH